MSKDAMFTARIVKQAKALMKETQSDTPSVRIEKFAAIIPTTPHYWSYASRWLGQQLIAFVRHKYVRLDKRPTTAKRYNRKRIENADDFFSQHGHQNLQELEYESTVIAAITERLRGIKNLKTSDTAAKVLTEKDVMEAIRIAKRLTYGPGTAEKKTAAKSEKNGQPEARV